MDIRRDGFTDWTVGMVIAVKRVPYARFHAGKNEPRVECETSSEVYLRFGALPSRWDYERSGNSLGRLLERFSAEKYLIKPATPLGDRR